MDPVRQPQSQALVFPPDNSEYSILHAELLRQREVITELIRFIEILPKPAGYNERLGAILNKLTQS